MFLTTVRRFGGHNSRVWRVAVCHPPGLGHSPRGDPYLTGRRSALVSAGPEPTVSGGLQVRRRGSFSPPHDAVARQWIPSECYGVFVCMIEGRDYAIWERDGLSAK